MPRKKVLVVDDDADIVALLKMYLERDGYGVITASNGKEALVLARDKHPDVVVLDVMLPGIDGREVCRRMREESGVPIILLTALTTEQDRISGLDMGADDYVSKPFSPKELMARVRALLRRLPENGRPMKTEIRLGELYLNLQCLEALINGKRLDLTATEFDLLALLAASPGRVFSRGDLITAVMGDDFQGFDRTVDAHVSNLRRKIKAAAPVSHIQIVPVYGQGYKLVADHVS